MLVFIHGGLFTSGSADVVGADLIMDEEIIFVTFQYRLAALGKAVNTCFGINISEKIAVT